MAQQSDPSARGDFTGGGDTKLPPQPEGGYSPDSPKIEARPRGLSKKTVAIILVAVLVVVSVAVAWFGYFGGRSIEDIADYVIDDPSLAAPGFKHSLAGDSLTVRGKVTNITTYSTTLGNMSFIVLDGFELLRLVVWDEVPYEVGDRIKTKVDFEWSVCNDESHVYSPQLDFPVFAYLPSIAEVMQSVAAVAGTYLEIESDTEASVVLEVFDQNPELPLEKVNCSLRVGMHSFTGEYVDILGLGTPEYPYGHDHGFLSNMTNLAERDDNVSFVDVDLDGNLSRYDRFELRNLTRPDQDSGVYTYALILGIDQSLNFTGLTVYSLPIAYMVMTSKGVLRIVDQGAPYMRIEGGATSTSEASFTFVRAATGTSWDDVILEVSDGTNFNHWNSSAEELDDGNASYADLPLIAVGALQMTCTVVDLAGNGVVDEGDYIVVRAAGGTEFAPGAIYEMLVIHEPTHERMASSHFSR